MSLKKNVLHIGEKEKEAIRTLIQYAEKNPVSLEDLKEIINGSKRPIGDNPNYVCYITDGYRVVYCIEQQPIGLCRHLSISVDTKNQLPSIEATENIMHQFGFVGTIRDCLNIWLEKNVDIPSIGKVTAVNVIQGY